MTTRFVPDFSEEFVDKLIAQMEALGARPYAEIGVPMFLVAEDLATEASSSMTEPGKDDDMAVLFGRMAEALSSRKPELDASDIARLVELFADRYFFDFISPPFSAIGALHPDVA